MGSSFFNRSQLNHLYVTLKQSTCGISEKYGCDPKTVYYWLRKYSIPIRPRKIIFIDRKELRKLYGDGRSLKEIGHSFNITPSAVYRKMENFHLSRRTPWESNIKHSRHDYRGNTKDKAYLIGFRTGDLSVTRRNSFCFISVKSNSTHPAQIQLMKMLFLNYGPTWISSSSKREGVYHFTSSLNSSFDFLLPKPTAIPTWILNTKSNFCSFLAGYTDAEGSIKIYAKRARMRIGSYDVGILEQIHKWLTVMKIKNSFRLEGKAVKHKHNHDFYRVDIMDRFALHRCLLLLIPYLKHEKRLQDAKLALENVTARM